MSKKEFIKRGHEPLIFYRVDSKIDKDLDFFLGDIRDDADGVEADAPAEAFIHPAGGLGCCRNYFHNPRPAAHTNSISGLNIFQAASQYSVPGRQCCCRRPLGKK